MAAEWTIYANMTGELGEDDGDGLTFNFRGYSGQTTPTPIVYANDVVVPVADYTFNAGSATAPISVTFDASHAGQAIRMDYRWMWELDAATAYEPEAFLSVLELEPIFNVVDGEDINGNPFALEGYAKASPWTGALGWNYISQETWELLRWLCSHKNVTIDIYCDYAIAPMNALENLYILKGPAYKPISGVPEKLDAFILVRQLS